jgi:hypothetical protein
MAHTLLTIDMITKETLRLLEGNLIFSRSVDRQYDTSFASSGAKIGDQLRVRKPVEFTVQDSSPALSPQDITETYTTITVSTQAHVDFTFGSKELALDIDDFSNRYLKKASSRLAAHIDAAGLALYKDVSNQVGTPGTPPSTALEILTAGQKLDEALAPRDDTRNVILNPSAQAKIVAGLSGLFQSSDRISEQYRRGQMGQGLGFNFLMDQNVAAHTTGDYGDNTGTLKAAPADGANTINVEAFSVSVPTTTIGDVFTIDGCYDVNQNSKVAYSYLKQFVVTNVVTGSSNELLGVTFSPSLNLAGPYQNISALPLINAPVTFVTGDPGPTTYATNIAYLPEAFTLVTADLDVPQGADMASREVYNGISLRIVRDYDISADTFPLRIDVLYGWETLRPELACRIAG